MFLLSVTSLLLGAIAPGARTLTTPHFTIHVTEMCEEGEVSCENVIYQSVSSNGRTLTLHGKVVSSLCKDGKTPCHPIGYKFRNGTYLYFLGEDGSLQVTNRAKEIVNEKGTWTDQ